METTEELHITAPNYRQAGIVIDAEKDPIASRRLDELMRRASIQIAPVTAHAAREAYLNLRRGSGHPANSTSATVSPTLWRLRLANVYSPREASLKRLIFALQRVSTYLVGRWAWRWNDSSPIF
jgi:ribonuclease VapC